MTVALHGCGLKLDRAKEHLDALKVEVAAFMNDAYVRTVELEADGREHSYRLYVRKKVPERWSLIFGDCLNNLRSSLDHLIFQLALTIQDPLPQNVERACAFPICSSQEQFDKQRWHIKAAPTAAVELVEDFQPYRAPEPEKDPLRILEVLNNIDKHRRLNIVASIMKSAYVFAPSPPDVVAQTASGLGAPVEDGMEYQRITFSRPKMEEQFDIPAGVEIVVLEPVPTEGIQGVVDLLGGIRDHILKTVIPRFASF